MIRFKDFLKEEVNSHLLHFEDRVWDSGVSGVLQTLEYANTFKDQLAGHAKKAMNISVKFDGSPAVFAGIDPTDGKFFVAKKGIFNANPKVYKTDADIDADTEGDLNTKLKLALEHFPKLGIRGIIQGDFLYAKSDLKKVVIDGKSYLTFHPNTIVYAVPEESKLAQKILRSQVGVVWHTVYTGSDFASLKASFGKEIASNLKKVTDVWSIDAVFKDVSGAASLTASETSDLEGLINKATDYLHSVPKEVFDVFSGHTDLNARLNTFINSKIRAGSRITNASAFATELKAFVEAYYQKEADKKKTDKGKQSSFDKRDSIYDAIHSVKSSEIIGMVNLYNTLIDIKMMIIAKLNQSNRLGTFLLTNKGYEVTAPEGYVCMDHIGKNAVKLVDRLEFSHANFSPDVKKGWTK